MKFVDSGSTSFNQLQYQGEQPVAESSTSNSVTLNPVIVGDDLFNDGSRYSGELDNIVIRSGVDTSHVDLSSGAVTASYEQTTNTDTTFFAHADNDGEFTDLNTMNQSYVDLTKATGDFDNFPDEPDKQSTVGASSNYATNVTAIDNSNVASEYYFRAIPAQTPSSDAVGSKNTLDEWKPHIDQGRSKRFKDQTVDDTTYTQDKLLIEDGSSSYLTLATDGYNEVRDVLTFPTSSPDTVTSTELNNIRQNRNSQNVTWTVEGGAQNTIYSDSDYIEASKAEISTNLRTAVSEMYSAFTGFDTVDNHEPDDTIFDSNDNLIKHKAEFPVRILNSIRSTSNLY